MSASADDIATTVRAADPDRYLSALYASESKRASLLALYAFNAEIAAVRDRIREPLPGEVRLQWWRDVLDAGTPEAAAGHPVAAALIAAVRDHDLPAAALQNYLDARVFDLYDDPMPSRGDLEGYCGETAGTILQLAAMILDRPAASAHAALAGHAACAQAITGLLRLQPLHRFRGQCFVPRDLLAAAGLTPETFLAGADPSAVRRALAGMISLAREHFLAFVADAKSLPPALRPAFLPLALTSAYLDRIEAAGFDVLAATSEPSSLRRHWLLLRHATRGW